MEYPWKFSYHEKFFHENLMPWNISVPWNFHEILKSVIPWNYHEIYNYFSPICSFLCVHIYTMYCVNVCVRCVCTRTCVVFMYVAMCVNVCMCVCTCVCVCVYVCVCYINGFNFVAVMEGSHADDAYTCSTIDFTIPFKNHT